MKTVTATPQPAPTQTYQTLLSQFGIYLSYGDLAQILKRDPEGLRISLTRCNQPWAQQVNKAKVKLGRRVLFSSAAIASVMDELTGK